MMSIEACENRARTAVLLSGGVDSLVAAHILKEQGHDVIGIHFVTGYEQPSSVQSLPASAKASAREYGSAESTAADLARQLKIPVEIMDCRQAFQSSVVNYFTRTYAAGQTPNPCLVCNPSIKFGTVFDFAKKLGAGRLATGHYARTHIDRQGICRLMRGQDRTKDQSYFLARLTQDRLSKAVFPLGTMTKQETVALARQAGLEPTAPKESQDVCFIHENNYGDFLMRQPGFTAAPGPIVDLHGNTIGRHAGLHLFTIGQRRGINCPGKEPYYVIDMDARDNSLTVGFKKDTLAGTCVVADINWIHTQPDRLLEVMTRVRYRHAAARSNVTILDKKRALVRFQSPQSAITPGQGAVFYSGEEVLGGGFIQKTTDDDAETVKA